MMWQAHLTSTWSGDSLYMQPTPMPCLVAMCLWPVWGPWVHPRALHLIVFVTTHCLRHFQHIMRLQLSRKLGVQSTAAVI